MKTNSFRRYFAVMATGVALAVLAATSGCIVAAAGVGAGAVAYVRGELTGTVPAGYEAAVRAANQAVKDLEFAKVGEEHDALFDKITARTAEDKKVEIRVEHLSDKTTTVKIRVGWVGDESTSIAILEKIKARA